MGSTIATNRRRLDSGRPVLQAVWQVQRRRRGLCATCGRRKLHTTTLCRTCAERLAAAYSARVARLRERGLCRCGAAIDDDYARCETCRAREAAAARARRARAR